MKVLTFILLALVIAVSSKAQNHSNTVFESKIARELTSVQTIHNIESWQLIAIKGINKVELVLEAIEYSSATNSEILKGIEVKLIPESLASSSDVTKSMKLFEAFIDQAEYAEVMVVINKMSADFKKRSSIKKRGSQLYTTKGGIKFGYIYSDRKEVGLISILFNDSEIYAEFSNIDKFFIDLRTNIDIASKELYLPENAEKLKNAKKSNQEVKDVIIDDI